MKILLITLATIAAIRSSSLGMIEHTSISHGVEHHVDISNCSVYRPVCG